MSTAATTTGTASVGLIRFPAAGPFTLDISVPNYTAFNLSGKYVSISFKKKCHGPSPVLFETNSSIVGGYVQITNPGGASQKIVILIPPSAVSTHDTTAVFSRKVAVEGLTVEFSIDVRSSSSADLSWRLQGNALWQDKHGTFTE
jgi:hypothetical protein